MLAAGAAGHFYWITSRAAGIAALVLTSASVGVGVTMGGRLIRGRVPDLRALHEALSLGALLALAIHGLSLVGDGFIGMNLADVTVPFASSFATFWVTLGVVGGWLLILLGLSYYFRARIGAQRWKRLHRWTLLGWLLGVVHAVGVGTDAGTAWFLLSVGVVVLPAAAMVALRLSGNSQATFTSGS
jgi:sulfoxide reductase heme-binding subunit YedZ